MMEKLIEQTHRDFMFGRTYFEEADKKWMACSYASSAQEETKEWPDGYEPLPIFYGATLEEVVKKAVKWTKENV